MSETDYLCECANPDCVVGHGATTCDRKCRKKENASLADRFRCILCAKWEQK